MNDSETPPATPSEPAAPTRSAQSTPYQAAGRTSPFGYVFFLGVLGLAAGLIWRGVEGDTGVVTDVWIFLSLLLMLVPPAWHAVDLGRSIASRRGKAFGYVLTTLALGVGVMAFIGWAAVKYKSRLPTFDLTRSARFSLSEESSKLLEKIPGTVYIAYLMQGPDADGVRHAALEQLRVFESASPRVRVREADSIRDPDGASRILREHGATKTTESGEDSDYIVLTYAEPGREVAPGKQKEIKVEKWTFFKMSAADESKWLGEGVIAAGIYELVFQKLKAYATGGHGELRLAQEYHKFRDVVTGQNVEVASDPLLLGAVPEIPDDCDLLFVLSPQTPFTPEEANLVGKWLDKGDRTLFLVVDLHEDRFSTGLDPVIERFGLHTRCNYAVVAPLLQKMRVNDQDVLVPSDMSDRFPLYGNSYADHAAATALRARTSLATHFFKTTYVEIDEKPEPGAAPEAVCYAPEAHGFPTVAQRHDPSRKDYRTIKEGVDKKTPPRLPLIATSTRKPREAGGKESRLVLSGDSDVFADDFVERAPANLDLARGLVQWSLRREGLVAVSARTLEDPIVTPTEYQRRFAQGWPLFACLLPLIAGGMVWWSRRR